MIILIRIDEKSKACQMQPSFVNVGVNSIQISFLRRNGQIISAFVCADNEVSQGIS